MISTYRDDFNHPQNLLPPVPHFQEPCMTIKDGQLNPRCFPFALPKFPARKRDSSIPIAAGFETLLHRLIPINNEIRTKKHLSPELTETPNEFDKEIPDTVFEELINFAVYTPSSKLPLFQPPDNRKRKPGFDLPTTKGLIPNVRYKPKVYNEKPGTWQQIGCAWDKVQERKGLGFTITREGNQRLLLRPQVNQPVLVKEEKTSNHFSSNIPGYGGYQPRLPNVIKKPELKCEQPKMIATSRRDYRKYPQISYSLPRSGHIGPLSRTVTLTQPYNPFNKISKTRITVQ